MATRIQPVEFPLGLGTANRLSVRCGAFNMSDKYVWISYDLQQETPIEEILPGIDPLKSVYKGTLLMGGTVYDNWGLSNEYVVEWVAEKLGLTLLPEPTIIEEDPNAPEPQPLV